MSDYKQFCKKHNFPCNAASTAAFDAYTKEESLEFVLGWSRSYFDERFKNRWDRKATDKDWEHFKENYDEINFHDVCDTIDDLMDDCLTDSFWNCSECDETVAGTFDADHAPAGWDGRLCKGCFTKMAVPCSNCRDEFVLQDNDDAFECHWKHKKDGVKVFWFCCVGCKDDYKYGHDYYFDNFHDYKEESSSVQT